MMNREWETLEERVRRHLRIPLKQKFEWLGKMLEFNSRHKLKLRKQVRAALRS